MTTLKRIRKLSANETLIKVLAALPPGLTAKIEWKPDDEVEAEYGNYSLWYVHIVALREPMRLFGIIPLPVPAELIAIYDPKTDTIHFKNKSWESTLAGIQIRSD